MEDPVGQLEQLGQDAGSPSILASDNYHPDEESAIEDADNPDLSCDDIIRHIKNLIRELIRRFTDLEIHNGGDEGHRTRTLAMQKLLEGYITQAVAACKNGEFSPSLEEEARDWATKELPRIASEPEPSTKDKIMEALEKAGVPRWAVAGLIVMIMADLADPEPFSKVAGAIGVAAAVIFFITIGRRSDVPPTAQASNTGDGAAV